MAKDFRNKQFGRIIRGYNPEEVDEYIAYINEEYRKLERRCADSERKLSLALKKLDEMHQKFMDSDTAGQEQAAGAVSGAREEADRIIEQANVRAGEITGAAEQEAGEKARMILEGAAKEAEEILASAEKDAADNRKTADALFVSAGKMYGEVCAFRDSLFEIYNTHIESIEHMTEEAERAMGVIEEAYSDDVGDGAEDVVPVEEEIAEDVASFDGGEPDDEEITEDTSAETAEESFNAEDLYIDLEAEADEVYKEGDAGKVYDQAYSDEEFGSDTEDAEYDAESEYADDYDAPDTADYAEDDGYADLDDADAFTIDWSSRHNTDDDNADQTDEEQDEDSEEAERSAFRNLDEMFSVEEEEEMSLTDEFDLVFNASNAKKNVEQIRKQPTVVPEKPKNPKKHQKF